jgi:hypothetical protein
MRCFKLGKHKRERHTTVGSTAGQADWPAATVDPFVCPRDLRQQLLMLPATVGMKQTQDFQTFHHSHAVEA